MNSGILLGEFTHVSSLRIPQSCRMNFSHNGSWHSAFAIRHFMIHRRMLFLRWQFSGTDSILNLGASGLQLTCTTLQLYQSTNTYYSCTIACWRWVSTTAVLNLVPPPGYYYYPVISLHLLPLLNNLSWDGTEESTEWWAYPAQRSRWSVFELNTFVQIDSHPLSIPATYCF